MVEPLPLPSAPFSHYYAQEVSDEGIIMETEIGIKEVSMGNNSGIQKRKAIVNQSR